LTNGTEAFTQRTEAWPVRCCEMSKQAAYASNLREKGYGTAIYKPLEFLEEDCERRIGDIAFFNREGEYKWVANVWNQSVFLLWGASTYRGLAFSRMGMARMEY
jgi:hypothetical protein